MSAKRFTLLPISRVIQALAISDSIFLVIAILELGLMQVDWKQMVISDISCKIYYWFTLSSPYSAFMILVISIERFIVVWFPQQAKHVFTVNTATSCIFVVGIILGIYNGIFVAYKYAAIDGECVSIRSSVVFAILCLLLYVIIPLFGLVIVNSLTITKLLLHRRHNGNIRSNQTINTNRVTAMLLAVVIVFVILYCTYTVSIFIAGRLETNLFQTDTWLLLVVGQLASLCNYLNSSINFYLYIVWGSTFRKHFLSLMPHCSIFRKKCLMSMIVWRK
jgi:hypothetical protein